MDIATLVGVIVAFTLIGTAIILGGGSFIAFFDAASVMVVVGGSIAATLISFPLKNFLRVFGVAMKTLLYKLDSILAGHVQPLTEALLDHDRRQLRKDMGTAE